MIPTTSPSASWSTSRRSNSAARRPFADCVPFVAAANRISPQQTTQYPGKLRERLYGRARAHQVAVAVGAVDAAHRRPHLGPESLAERVGRLLAGVRMIPVGHQQAFRRMRSTAQRVVIN